MHEATKAKYVIPKINSDRNTLKKNYFVRFVDRVIVIERKIIIIYQLTAYALLTWYLLVFCVKSETDGKLERNYL